MIAANEASTASAGIPTASAVEALPSAMFATVKEEKKPVTFTHIMGQVRRLPKSDYLETLPFSLTRLTATNLHSVPELSILFSSFASCWEGLIR